MITRTSDKLTVSENLLLRELKKGKKPRDAAKAALNPKNDNSASSLASQMMKRERFQRALERAGLTDAVLAKTFVEGVKANKPVVVDKKIYDYPDYSTRHQFVKTALVVKGYYRRTDDAEESEHAPLIVNSIQLLNQSVKVENGGVSINDAEAVDASIVSDKKDSGNIR